MKTQTNQITQLDTMIHNAAKALYSQFAEQYGTGRFRKRGECDYRFTVDFVGAFHFCEDGVFINQGEGLISLVGMTDGKIDFINTSGLVPLSAAVVSALSDHGFVCKSGDIANMLTVLTLNEKVSLIDMMRLAADLAEYAGLEGDAVRYMGLDGITVQGPDYRLFMQVGGVSLTVKMFAYGQSDWSEYLNIFDEDRDCLIDSIDYLNEEFVDECKSRYETDLLIEELEQLNQIAA